MDIGNYGGRIITPCRWGGLGWLGGVLGLEPGDVGADCRITPMPLQECTQPGARMAEQRTVDEVDGCGGALDVQKDRANLAQLDAVRSGMYVGPMQSG